MQLDRADYDMIEVGSDTLAVFRGAMRPQSPLRTAWQLAIRS